MLPGKQGGSDGLVGEMLKLIDWPALDRIRFAFEQRLNCASGYCDPMADWDTQYPRSLHPQDPHRLSLEVV